MEILFKCQTLWHSWFRQIFFPFYFIAPCSCSGIPVRTAFLSLFHAALEKKKTKQEEESCDYGGYCFVTDKRASVCCTSGRHLHLPPSRLICPLGWQSQLPARSSDWKSECGSRFLCWAFFSKQSEIGRMMGSQGSDNSLFFLERFYVKEKLSLSRPWFLKLLECKSPPL